MKIAKCKSQNDRPASLYLFFFIFQFVICILTSTASAAQVAPPMTELVARAKAEGGLDYIAGGGTLGGIEGFKALGDALNKKFGVNLKFSYTPGASMPRMAARLVQEARAGKPASIDFFLGRASHVVPMMRQKALAPFAWSRHFPYISEAMVFHEGRIVRVGSRFDTVFSYNSKLVPKDQVPRKLEDLLLPQWKGKIAVTPYASGFADVSLELGVAEKALAFHRRLVDHAGGVMRSGELERIASGEFWMLAVTGHHSAEEAKERGLPVDWGLLEDFVGMNFSYMVVPKNSAHPNAARLFIGFLLSPDGQKLLWEHTKEDLHLVEGSRMNARVKALQAKGAKIAFDDLKNWEDENYVKRRGELEEKFVKQVRTN